ncbi:hypothetical protein E2562_037256 [Oryza meyeriana var. granulata]|uniref:Uncharacterized protein n=1 Tax=Oryza meyeriana var. granulata TaxID=110450 RepID=A0A6G1ECR8_9ORYZ|nr:hypothetical protein E2562_037256 [Oryza meyeriana var. granulata]
MGALRAADRQGRGHEQWVWWPRALGAVDLVAAVGPGAVDLADTGLSDNGEQWIRPSLSGRARLLR